MEAVGIEEEHMTIEKIELADVPELIASGELRERRPSSACCWPRASAAWRALARRLRSSCRSRPRSS